MKTPWVRRTALWPLAMVAGFLTMAVVWFLFVFVGVTQGRIKEGIVAGLAFGVAAGLLVYTEVRDP